MKRRLKSTILGALLSAICLPTLIANTVSYAEDSETFAGGNNSWTAGTHSETNQEGWGITFNTTGGNPTSRIVGAKVSVYYTTDSDIIAGAKERTGKNLNTYLHNNMGSFLHYVKTTYGINGIVSDNSSFYLCSDNSYLTYITGYTPYPKSGWATNIPQWVRRNSETDTLVLGLNSMNIVGPPMALQGTINDSLYNSEVWRISADQRWFVGGDNTGGYSETGSGALPTRTKETIIAGTEALTKTGTSVQIPAGALTLWFVEPLVSSDIEMSDGSWLRVALTPTMLAYYADKSDELGLSLTGWSSTDGSGTSIWESIIKSTSTNGLTGNSSFSDSTMGGMLSAVNNQSYGAYAVAVKPAEKVVRDTLPDLPSIPVFQKDGSIIEYMGVSSTIPADTWAEITAVLKYAMNLTTSEPSSSLYSFCSGQVADMKNYADNVYDDAGNYDDSYKTYYRVLWNRICGYYNDKTLELGTTSATLPARLNTNQPSDVQYKFGGSSGPFVVKEPMGAIGSDMTLNYQNASFYNLNNSKGIVQTSATSTGSLGSAVSGNTITIGDVLRNPYAYSVVIDPLNVSSSEGYPEPPNIVVWDEKQGKVDSAFMEVSIDPGTWSTVLNTMKYARNDGGSNPLNIASANEAKAHAEFLGTVSEYNTWQTQKKNAEDYKSKLNTLKTTMENGIGELEDILWNTLIVDESRCGEYGGSNFAYVRSDGYAYNIAGTVMEHMRNGSSAIAYTDVFQVFSDLNMVINDYGGMSGDVGYGTWEGLYRHVMEDKYYNGCASWTVKAGYGDSYSVDGWERQYYQLFGDMRWACPDMPASDDYALAMLDVFCYWYLREQINTYKDIKDNHISAALTDVQNKIDELNTKINEFDGHLEGFNKKYEATIETLMKSSFSTLSVVDGTKGSDNAITNHVTQNVYKRGNNKAVDGMSKPFEYPTWVLSGTPKQVSQGKKATTSMYSAYNEDGSRYVIGDITNNSMYNTIDALMKTDGVYNLNFKCRVVKAGNSASDVMTRDLITMKASGACGYTLSYNDVFAQPYSYGIIINSLDIDTTSTKIQEWQLMEYMMKDDLDDSSVWTGWGVSSTDGPSFTLTNTPPNTVITRYIPSAGKLSWMITKKTGENAPGLATDIKTSLGGKALVSDSITEGEASWTSGTYIDTGLYKITHDWGGGTGTMEILTAEITSVASVPTNNTATVVGDANTYQYNHANTADSGDNGGTYLNIWKDNGSLELKAIFPMMVASWNDATLGWNDYPTKTISNASMGSYNVINSNMGLGVNGYRPEWCHSNVTHTMDSPFNVVIAYRSNTTIKTTFSTDKEDADGMQNDIADSLSPIPYVKAGQTFGGTVGNNVITIKGYANIGKNTDFIRNNNLRFKTENEFIDYMNSIVNSIKANAKVEVVSTINSFNVNSLNEAVAGGEDFAVTLTEANAHVDNDAGVQFSNSVLLNPEPTLGVSKGSKSYENAYFRPYGSTYNSFVNGPLTAQLATKTQLKYNNLLNHGLGTTASWYYEYSEALGIAYYEATINFDDYTFTGTISRYESDAETEPDYYVKKQYSTISNAWKNFGYDTYLMKSEGRNAGDPVNVVATAIDLTDVLADSPELTELFTKDDGTVISKLLGKQTPIHIRGSVYDNT